MKKIILFLFAFQLLAAVASRAQSITIDDSSGVYSCVTVNIILHATNGSTPPFCSLQSNSFTTASYTYFSDISAVNGGSGGPEWSMGGPASTGSSAAWEWAELDFVGQGTVVIGDPGSACGSYTRQVAIQLACMMGGQQNPAPRWIGSYGGNITIRY